MPRPKTYNPDHALDAAMRVFWRNGFEGASYGDLTRATGVGRKGLYATFGDKHSLFVKALQRYRGTTALAILEGLDAPDAGPDAIRTVFETVAALAKSPDGATGCFMANTATDPAVAQAEVARQVALHLDRTSARFRAPLLRAGLSAARAAALADHLTGLLQGLFVLARARARHDMIDAHVREGLRALPA
ncbi:MAG: TetR/AcrR family transcriptional regulator [Pseudomonadota bacterium]